MDLFLTQLKEIWYVPIVLVFNIFVFLTMDRWWRWINIVGALVMALILTVVGFAMFDSYSSGCYSAPKLVEFKQGMTLCPGQSASVSVTFDPPK